MTNILQLPTALSGALPVVADADWRTTIQFNWPAGGAHAGEPLDISGIAFRVQVRKSVNDATILLDCSTSNGLLVVDGPLGQLSFAVPRDRPTASGAPSWAMASLAQYAGTSAVTDIVAAADGMILNLCQEGAPIVVPIATGVTRDQPSPT